MFDPPSHKVVQYKNNALASNPSNDNESRGKFN